MTMRRIVSRLALWLAIAMTATAGTALAGGNPNFTLPLHAKVTTGSESCQGYLPVDCLSVGPGGHDACAATTPVAAATWGSIKQSYR